MSPDREAYARALMRPEMKLHFRFACEIRQSLSLTQRTRERARFLAAAGLGRFTRTPKEREWIQFQFYHWLLDDQRREFRRQLMFLRQYGDFISLDDAVAALAPGSRIGGRYFCLTVDDGFKNALTNVAPILSELAIPAAFFVPTQYIGLALETDWDAIASFYEAAWSDCGGVFEFLDWAECAQLAAAGFTIGSHGHSHRRLAGLPLEEVRREMALSRQIIEQKLSKSCRHFCCPWGKVNRDFDSVLHPHLAREAGYESFLTAENGLCISGDSAFYIRRNGCEPDFGPAGLLYSLFSRSARRNGSRREGSQNRQRLTNITEAEPVQVEKFPYPFQAAFTVASDIDSASPARFDAVHNLFCREAILKPGTPDWQALGLRPDDELFDFEPGGIRGLGLGFADSFFLVGDGTTFGMYRHDPETDSFMFDRAADGRDCCRLIREWIRDGEMDSFHACLNYTREQLAPLLQAFYGWCDSEGVAKPAVWINHSLAVTPTGLCPRRLQPNVAGRLIRVAVRNTLVPMIRGRHVPLRSAFARYCGDSPGSPHYINDLLAANGLRFVWLNMDDLRRNTIALPEKRLNGRDSILQPVTMNDGTRYYRFDRCYGRPFSKMGADSYLRDSAEGVDASSLITEQNLQTLCRARGTCILYTHWTHPRSYPLTGDTVARFRLLRRWRDAGRIWVTSAGKLLEWTRRRTFLRVACHREAQRWIVDLEGVNDPIFGSEKVGLSELNGLGLSFRSPLPQVTISIGGCALESRHVRRMGSFCWLDAKGQAQQSE